MRLSVNPRFTGGYLVSWCHGGFPGCREPEATTGPRAPVVRLVDFPQIVYNRTSIGHTH